MFLECLRTVKCYIFRTGIQQVAAVGTLQISYGNILKHVFLQLGFRLSVDVLSMDLHIDVVLGDVIESSVERIITAYLFRSLGFM